MIGEPVALTLKANGEPCATVPETGGAMMAGRAIGVYPPNVMPPPVEETVNAAAPSAVMTICVPETKFATDALNPFEAVSTVNFCEPLGTNPLISETSSEPLNEQLPDTAT